MHEIKQATRTGLGGMAPDVKHQHILKCFEQSNAMAFLARILDLALGKAQLVDFCPARQESACLRLVNEVKRAPQPGILGEFICR